MLPCRPISEAGTPTELSQDLPFLSGRPFPWLQKNFCSRGPSLGPLSSLGSFSSSVLGVLPEAKETGLLAEGFLDSTEPHSNYDEGLSSRPFLHRRIAKPFIAKKSPRVDSLTGSIRSYSTTVAPLPGAFYPWAVPQDYVLAHMWLNLAASKSSGKERDAYAASRDSLAEKMTREQISEAQKLAREWKPKGEKSGD